MSNHKHERIAALANRHKEGREKGEEKGGHQAAKTTRYNSQLKYEREEIEMGVLWK